MPVKKDASGNRSVEVEVEVPGTPEEVWRAVATGTGISAWFVPTELEERKGGTTVSHFSPDGSMDSVATITDWEPPRRFAAETTEQPGTVATEWTVETRAGGTCTVRVVHRWFASTDEWDDQFEGHTGGWLSAFRILRLYLASFSGQPCASFQVMGVSAAPKPEAWSTLTRALGFSSLAEGARVSTTAGTPPLAGTVVYAGQAEWPEQVLLQLDEPTRGSAFLMALAMGGRVYLTFRAFLYGEEALAIAERVEASWKAWFGEQFPPELPAHAAPTDAHE
ncbi:SRPBCC family protein [Chondromyces crocatus]|uniref:ATPase n=1 Tax=Chondromyces crocatus TaxID=52 RepID=A0A0K1EK06_CHOCO|nr:SRPBCC domain-containing protein [Chondromyces crocatus]AKT41184.1 uncharacterized protein CMC5_053450 [Chondromyces crocatus]